MITLAASTIKRDCFENDYKVCHMPGSGFCGFHVLSHCFVGIQLLYADIIEDCINVFTRFLELFRLRTNYATHKDSTVTFNDYLDFMQEAMLQVNEVRMIDDDAWCEDGHLAAISLLYDIMIFSYSTQTSQWSVFNESGRRGYICLLNFVGHFDVLTGVNGPPILPVAAHTHCVTRDAFYASDDVWQRLQRNY